MFGSHQRDFLLGAKVLDLGIPSITEVVISASFPAPSVASTLASQGARRTIFVELKEKRAVVIFE